MTPCESSDVVVEQIVELISEAIRALRNEPFERSGEIRPLVQLAQHELRALTADLNNSFRPSTLSLGERIASAREHIACAEKTIASLGNLDELAALALNRPIGQFRSLLDLQPTLQALKAAMNKAEDEVVRRIAG